MQPSHYGSLSPVFPGGVVATATSRLKDRQTEDCRDNAYNYRKRFDEAGMSKLPDFIKSLIVILFCFAP